MLTSPTLTHTSSTEKLSKARGKARLAEGASRKRLDPGGTGERNQTVLGVGVA